jgi:hypothetical protein
MNRLSLLPVALAVVMWGCSNLAPRTIVSPVASVLTPMLLIETIDAHRGQTVTVSGYFTYVTDTQALWQNESAHREAEQLRKGSWDKCITIYPSTSKARQFNGRHVQITGKATVIGKDDMRSLWTCNPVAQSSTRDSR